VIEIAGEVVEAVSPEQVENKIVRVLTQFVVFATLRNLEV
jgi:hypothetical protein